VQPLDLDEVREYVNTHISLFHEKRIDLLSRLALGNLFTKNPYLFRAKNITQAAELIAGTMSARLSSSEEKEFGDFLEGLAIFIAGKTSGGHASGTTGVDLEFENHGIHYFVSIKSGPNWGNSSQHTQLGIDLQKAVTTYKRRWGQQKPADSVLGICYGKTQTNRSKNGYLKLVGQNFWTFISGNRELYKEIIEPLGYRAKEHNDEYNRRYGEVANRLTRQFLEEYCDANGVIDWARVVEANSGNYDLDKHGLSF